jgi:hypothetical protein
MTIVDDAMKASMPGTAKQFLGSVQPKPMGQMIMYVAIIALLPLIGYILGGLIGWGGITWGVIMGVIMYIGTIITVVVTGILVSMLSAGMLGRQVSKEEAMTVIGYAATPAIAIGLLAGLMSGFWGGLALLGSVISFVGWIYMAYLLYLGGGARYGMDKALPFVAVSVIAWIIISFIFSAIAGAIVWSMLWSSLYANPYAGYAGRYAAYYAYP